MIFKLKTVQRRPQHITSKEYGSVDGFVELHITKPPMQKVETHCWD